MQDDFYTNMHNLNHSNNFFNNYKTMNKTSSLLLFFTAFYIIVWLILYVINLPYFAINQINLFTKGIEVNLNIVQENLSKKQYSFFSPSLDEMRLNFEALPSIRSAKILRQYPNKVDVILEKQKAFAVWGNLEDNLYLNEEGEIYAGGSYDEARVSIQLDGKTEDATYIVEKYKDLQKLFTEKIIYLKYSNENNWLIKLSGEIYLTLGKDSKEVLSNKIKFWHNSWSKLKINPQYKDVNTFDLRYDGFTFKLPNNQNINASSSISNSNNDIINEDIPLLNED